MSVPIKAETRLILACVRTEPEVNIIEDLLERGLDWDVTLRKAEQFGLAPLLHVNLQRGAKSGRVPLHITERLRHLYHLEAIRSIALRQALRTILVRFSEASVPVIVLKGAALAELIYPSPVLRTMGDIDLLVHRRDLGKVDELFRSLSYSPDSLPYSTSGRLRRGQRNLHYVRMAKFPAIEIHYHLFDYNNKANRAIARVPIPIEEFWRRARRVPIASVPALVLSREDLLTHIAIHLAERLSRADGFPGNLRTLCDIGEMCKRWRNDFDWNWLVRRARAYNVDGHLHCSLSLARDLAGADLPRRALMDLKPGPGRSPLESRSIRFSARRAGFLDDLPRPLSNVGVKLPATRGAMDGIVIANPSSQSKRSVGNCGELAVTYDQSATDGVGAQLQRIYGLYALSRALNIKYVHTPLGRVEYQGFLPLLAGHSDPNFAARYNAFFSLPSDDFDLERCERVRPKDHLDQETIEHYRAYAAATGRPVLLQALSGYGYTDSYPAAYHALRAITPYREHQPTGPIRVCIHVRRADNNVPDRPDRSYRWLPNAYYLRVCNTVIDALREQGASFVLRLHTEIPSRPYTLHPGMPGIYFKLDQPATIDPAEYELEEFESLPNLHMVLNVEAQQALDDFATADVLILSLSSFSYLGGLLNPQGLVIYAPWWHSALPDWLVATRDGELENLQLRTRIADYVRRRDQD